MSAVVKPVYEYTLCYEDSESVIVAERMELNRGILEFWRHGYITHYVFEFPVKITVTPIVNS